MWICLVHCVSHLQVKNQIGNEIHLSQAIHTESHDTCTNTPDIRLQTNKHTHTHTGIDTPIRTGTHRQAANKHKHTHIRTHTQYKLYILI